MDWVPPESVIEMTVLTKIPTSFTAHEPVEYGVIINQSVSTVNVP